MNVQDAIAQIQMILGFRSDLVDQIRKQLEFAQDYYEKGPTYPWFLLSELSTSSTSVEGRKLLLPEDFLAEYEEGCLYIVNDPDEDDRCLVKDSYEQLTHVIGTKATGLPSHYAMDGGYFRLFPLPDAAYPVKMFYYKKDVRITGLSNTETCLWLTHAPDCIIGWAGQYLAAGVRDSVAADKFQKIEAAGKILLFNQNEARKHSNMTYQIGGPEV